MAKGTAHVALLRGINVGGKNRLKMAALIELFEEAGCTDTTTYIQSGNVIFRASAALAKKLPDLISSRIAQEHDLQVPVLLRSAKDMTKICQINPYLDEEERSLHVAYLQKAPTKAAAANLDPQRDPTARFTLIGKELYLHYPQGLGRSKLNNAYLDKVLATTTTVRNWRTTRTLTEMALDL